MNSIGLAKCDALMDVYKPPENDGSFSQIMSGEKGVKGALKSKAEDVRSSAVSIAARRWSKALKKMKQADPTFEVETFGEKALEIYAQAHKALENREEERLHDLVTEYAFPNMWSELKNKTLKWEYVRSLEPPKVVHLRCGGETEDMTFGQATVRFHSQQKLAIYDQFGRLYFGDGNAIRDVLEYVVFENFLASEYGTWRLHAKILSKKSEAPPGIVKTFRKRDDQKSDKELVYKYSTKFDERTMDDEQTQQEQESISDEKNTKNA
uniref:Large ribosomal subunit protein mL45 n=1 Tax=Romanomermis culicivorax TaxID=13658 RepID=A0A915L8K6_ROMCU